MSPAPAGPSADAGPLVDGTSYAYTARVEDAADNLGAASNAYDITIDTSAPTQTVVISSITDDVAPTTGTVADGGTTNDTAPALAGTLSAILGAGRGAVDLPRRHQDRRRPMSPAPAGPSPTAGPLVDGTSYAYTARVEDAADNLGAASNAYDITIDTSAPTQTVTIDTITDDVAPTTGTVADGGITNDTAPALAGTLSAILGAGEVLSIFRDGVKIGEANVAGTGWTFTDAGPLVDGTSYAYTARVEDAADNLGAASNAYDITIDTSAPTQTVVISTITDDVAPTTGRSPTAAPPTTPPRHWPARCRPFWAPARCCRSSATASRLARPLSPAPTGPLPTPPAPSSTARATFTPPGSRTPPTISGRPATPTTSPSTPALPPRR